MIDHFEFKVAEFDKCIEFYTLVLKPLYIENKWLEADAAGFGLVSEDKTRLLIEKSMTTSKLHIAFQAAESSMVDEFHLQGVENGFKCNGVPGLRDSYASNYYAAFLLDPDGNNIEAVAYL